MHATPSAGLPEMAYAATPALVDRDTLVAASALGLVPLLLAGLVVLVERWRGHDEMFDDMTPGRLRPDGTAGSRHRVRGGEWSGTVAPAFAPPPDVRPGVVGTVVDGVADPHDVGATLLERIFEGRDVVRLSALKGSFGLTMREAQVGLYREVADAATWMTRPGDLFDGGQGFTDATGSLFSFDGPRGCGDGCDGSHLPGCDLPGCDF